LIPIEFRGDVWRKKTRVPGLMCVTVNVLCVELF